jgi:hypothetical protein
MHQRRLTKLLLMPSLTSGSLAIGSALAVLGYSGWLFISENQLFYDYLFSAYGLHTFAWTQVGNSAWHRSFLASPLAYYALVAAAAAAAGLAVYTVLQGATLVLNWTTSLVKEARDPSASRRAIFNEQLARLGLRIVTLAGWGLYGAFFVSTLVPFTIVLTQFGVGRIEAGSSMGWLQCFGAVVLFAATLHLHVVFARLCLLKPRVFGGGAAIKEVEAEEEAEHGQMIIESKVEDDQN